jgi:hypothetical protein
MPAGRRVLPDIALELETRMNRTEWDFDFALTHVTGAMHWPELPMPDAHEGRRPKSSLTQQS